MTEKREDSNTTKAIPKPEVMSHDLGKLIFPSTNLASAQHTTEIARPKTKSRPLAVSTGIFVNGKQKSGSKTITKNSDKKDSLSKICDRMGIIIYVFSFKNNYTTMLISRFLT